MYAVQGSMPDGLRVARNAEPNNTRTCGAQGPLVLPALKSTYCEDPSPALCLRLHLSFACSGVQSFTAMAPFTHHVAKSLTGKPAGRLGGGRQPGLSSIAQLS